MVEVILQMKTIALRRHHRKRMISRAKEICRVTFKIPEEEIETQALKLADNLKKCSCGLCRNKKWDRAKQKVFSIDW
jgi:hypothetical protein